MQELKANMAVLGKEASAALAAVDAQQQRLTFQRLVAMVWKYAIVVIISTYAKHVISLGFQLKILLMIF